MHPEYARYQVLKDLHRRAKELAQSLAEFIQRPGTAPAVRTICGRINEHVDRFFQHCETEYILDDNESMESTSMEVRRKVHAALDPLVECLEELVAAATADLLAVEEAAYVESRIDAIIEAVEHPHAEQP